MYTPLFLNSPVVEWLAVNELVYTDNLITVILLTEQHQMQFSQPLVHQQFQGRQMSSGHVQHGISQSQLGQGNQMNRHLSQFSSATNSGLFNAAQTTPSSQMVRYLHP